MGLQQFHEAIDKLSGTKSTHIVETEEEPILRVAWDGRPNDYGTTVGDLKEQHDVVQVETPSDEVERTADGMPVLYYAPR